jgi:hypothetical protein
MVKLSFTILRGVVHILWHWAYIKTDKYPVPVEVLVFEISPIEINSIFAPMKHSLIDM